MKAATAKQPKENKTAVDAEKYEHISLALIDPSPFEPQVKRRARMTGVEIDELAQSIKEQGLLHAIIVRPKDKRFEIVIGERRFLAVKKLGLSVIEAKVRDLDDIVALDIQLVENLQRKDVHPMDEAWGYTMLAARGESTADIALRVGKSETYVLRRMKLNNLIAEAQQDVDAGFLPLTYATELAKYSQKGQQELYNSWDFFEDGDYNQKTQEYDKDKTRIGLSLAEVSAWMKRNVLLNLKEARFSTEATDLRADGLACVVCPERTGATPLLFDKDVLGKNDSCLNESCYKAKAAAFVQIKRSTLATKLKVEAPEVPVISTHHQIAVENADNASDRDGAPAGSVLPDNYVRKGNWNWKKDCTNAVKGISADPDDAGQIVEICLRSSGCKTHWPISNGKTAGSSKSASTTVAGQKSSKPDPKISERNEELWDIKVANAVRLKVFSEAGAKFVKASKMSGLGDDFIAETISKFWKASSQGEHAVTKTLVLEKLLTELDPEAAKSARFGAWSDLDVDTVANWSEATQKFVLFVFVHGNKGCMQYNRYASQKKVRKLAEQYDLNYKLIDAQVRVDLAPKKHKPIHQNYLNAVEAGDKNAALPRVYLASYKVKD
jgi:ParB/RepB/Spo0J family partition protein